MAKFVIETPGLENYGTHDGSVDRWKFKGGETYIVTGFDREQDAVAFVLTLIDNSSGSWRYYPAVVSSYDDWIVSFQDDEHMKHCLTYAQRIDADGSVDNRIYQ